MKVPVAPFLIAPEDGVRHGGWQLSTPEGDTPLPAELSHWDYQTTLDLSAAVFVDRHAIAMACGLEIDSGLKILVTAHSDFTRTEQRVCALEIPKQHTFDLAVRVELAGDQLGGRLTLRTFLVVTDPRPVSELAPSHAGSIVWRAQQRTHLQGIGAQFPTDASDFSITRPSQPDSAWELRVEMSDLDARFISAARLTLNSACLPVQHLLEGRLDAQTDQLRRTLRWDVTRQLVDLALGSEDVITAEFDPDATSVGGVLRNVLARVWPQESPITIRSWWNDDPSRVELQLQSHCGLVG